MITPDPKKCGMGMGERCCAYLLCGAKGFECGRESEMMRNAIDGKVRDGTMTALRQPGAVFPNCYLEVEDA